MTKLRLLLFEECNRKCPGCCNQDWDLSGLEKETNFKDYDLIMLTGGEPMLRPDLIRKVSDEITRQTNAPIYLYTAKVDSLYDVFDILNYVDGMTITLHEQKDVAAFLKMIGRFKKQLRKKSMRLNIFEGIEVPDLVLKSLSDWSIKRDIEWIKDLPLPEDELLRRYHNGDL